MPRPRHPRPDAHTLRQLAVVHDGNATLIAMALGSPLRTVQRWLAALVDKPTPEDWAADEIADRQARAALRRALVDVAGDALLSALPEIEDPAVRADLALRALERLRVADEVEARDAIEVHARVDRDLVLAACMRAVGPMPMIDGTAYGD